MPKKDLANDEKTLDRLTHLGRKLLRQLNNEEDENLTFETQVRSKSNVEYDEDEERLELGDSYSTRKFLNISHARKFMQTTLVASKCKELVEGGRTASIREVYYQLKHTVPGLDENTFEDQDESNNVVVDIETATGAIREDLHLFAEPKGRLFGPIKIEDSGDIIDGMSMGSSGMAINSIVDHFEFVENNADFILVVETSAMVNRLVKKTSTKNTTQYYRYRRTASTWSKKTHQHDAQRTRPSSLRIYRRRPLGILHLLSTQIRIHVSCIPIRSTSHTRRKVNRYDHGRHRRVRP